MTERIIQLTDDGSHTVIVANTNITYHSAHGAIQESLHVFINAGLQYFIERSQQHENKTINIFEMGFGTGLNALLSLHQAVELNQKIFYEAIETEPLTLKEINELNYTSIISQNLKKEFFALHECDWNAEVVIHPLFLFKKIKASLQQFETQQKFDIIYFDAFDPNTQPELWTEAVFKNMLDVLNTNGILVTYCSKGDVRRAMKSAGFNVEKLKGAVGKREMLRTIRKQ